ncbi:uncharacterized [Tachysurus ichikawai]
MKPTQQSHLPEIEAHSCQQGQEPRMSGTHYGVPSFPFRARASEEQGRGAAFSTTQQRERMMAQRHSL